MTATIRRICAVLLVAVATNSGASAGQAGSSDLASAVEKAILTNPEVLARWHEYQAAASDQEAARAGYRPRVDAQLFSGREERDDPGSGSDDYTHSGYLLELRQMLFDGYATRSEVAREGFNKLARYYDLLAITDEVAFEVARAYFDVLRYQQFVGLAKDNWRVHKELFDQIARRTRAGVGRGVDLEQAAGRLALARSNWLTEKSNLHDVRERFRRLVGEAPGDTLPLPESVGERLALEEDWLVETLRQNPTFRSAVAQVRSRRAGIQAARAGNYPTLEFRASHSSDDNLNGIRGDTDVSTLQLVLNYNLYRGGGDAARIKSARSAFETAIDLRDKTCRDIRQQAAITWNSVLKLKEQLRYLEQHALSTEKARTAYRQQFDIGQRTLLDLLDTENEYFSAQRALADARHNLRIEEYRILALRHRILAALNLAPLAQSAPEEADIHKEEEDAAIRCNTALERLSAPEPEEPGVSAVTALASELNTALAKSDIRIRERRDLLQLDIPGIVFATNSDRISPAFLVELDKVAESLKEYPGAHLHIIGHTDSVGNAAYNMELSKRRAESVANYLISKGFESSRLRTSGQGELNPVASNSTADGRARNRRVEILVSLTGKPGS